MFKKNKFRTQGANHVPTILGSSAAALHLFLYVPDLFANSLKTAGIVGRIFIFTALASGYVSMFMTEEEMAERGQCC